MMERLLRTVGIETFIKYYTYFEKRLYTDELIKVFEKNGETWKFSSFTTKANAGKAIFNNNYQLDALNFVIQSNENKVGGGKATIMRARTILEENLRVT